MKKLYGVIAAVCLLLQVNLVICNTIGPPASQQCRDREVYTDPTDFRLRSCANCYSYLFPEQTSFVILIVSGNYMFEVSSTVINGSAQPTYTAVVPDIYNETVTKRICNTLNYDECGRWKRCCFSAIECCDKQLNSNPRVNGSGCAQVWDGYSCWDNTDAGITVSQQCPAFVKHFSPSARSHKTCWDNGTWYVHADGNEWTDYTKCSDISAHTLVTIIGIVCEAASIIVLIPSIVIFLSYRMLRKQHRIKLHMNLFCSFMLTGVTFILWDTVVVLDRVYAPEEKSVLSQNGPGCKLLYALTRYFRSTNYIWMLCEGYYLHRLIVHTFEPPKRLIAFYVLGWGFPWLPVGIYSILRAVFADKRCWVEIFGGVEWLIYAPNILSLLLNLFFLCNILRILLTQLQSHPNEPSNYRRALKATFILIPLFGSQLILIIYRPPYDSAVSQVYEILHAIITHSQGFFVALIFCFCNGEVHSYLRRTWVNVTGRKYPSSRHDSNSTQVTTEYSRTHVSRPNSTTNPNYIPMKAIKESNGGGTSLYG